jgi:hypothetical protein
MKPVRKIVLFLATLGLIACLCCLTGSTEPLSLAERAPDWEALFKRTSGWTGADGIYSIPLSGNDAPGSAAHSQTLFVFGDTFIGRVGPEGGRLQGTSICRNTVALLTGGKPCANRIHFHWNTDPQGGPEAVFTPSTPNAAPGEWHWLMDGVSLNGKVYLFAQRMKPARGAVFNFAVDGAALLSVPIDSLTPPRQYKEVETPLHVELRDGRGEMIFGGAVMVNTRAARSPSPDGFIYIYGTLSNTLGKKLVVARVAPDCLEDFGAWRFWDGSDWAATIESSMTLADNLSSEFSVSPLSEGGFALVFQLNALGRDVAIQISKSPVGPFGQPLTVWTCPEPDLDPHIFAYNAKAHPHLSQPGELLISYNVNTFDSADHFSNADIYRPRFIRVQISALQEALSRASPPIHDLPAALSRIIHEPRLPQMIQE